MKHQVLGGKFELLRELGTESWRSSNVYLARDMSRGKEVCLKISTKRGFEREFNVLKQLKHRNVPTAYEHGTFEYQRQEAKYLSRGFIYGVDLFTHFRDYAFTNQKLRASAVSSDIKEAGKIVAYIHGLRKYHRDLKTYDFVRHNRSVFLIDLESVLDVDQDCNDRSRVFSAPEVISIMMNSRPGPKSDIYSLGMVMFDMFAAYDPEAQDMLKRQSGHMPIEIAKTCELDIPVPMMDAIRKATDYDQKRRYRTVDAFVKDIDRARRKL